MPYAILLAGPQGSGKSTFTQSVLPDIMSVSTDTYIQSRAKKLKKSYSDIFVEEYNSAYIAMIEDIRIAQELNLSFIVDRTHINERSRKQTLRLIKPTYIKIAIYFPALDIDVLMSRISQRTDNGGHWVNQEYVEDKIRNYQTPKMSEGFDMIFTASGFERLYKHMDFRNA